MAEILVVFPPGGKDPQVNHAIERVPKGHVISWDIVSCDDSVKYVEIEFENADAKFFNGVTTKYGKTLTDGKAVIWGQVQFPPGNPPGPFYGKYTVTGFTGQGGAKVSTLDPVIVTGDPG